MTSKSITSDQKKQFGRFLEDAGDRALKEVNPDRESLQRLLARGGDFQRHVIAGIRQFSAKVPVASDRFGFVTEFPVVVPADYDHATCLANFHAQHRKDFYYWNDDLTDAHFPNPTRILKPGDRFLVKVFAQTVSGSTTSVERLDFVKSQGGILVGAQGLPLVWQQQRAQLPRGYWYSSFDEPDRLWEDAARCHRVPCLNAYSDGDWEARLGGFGDGWNANDRLLCFCDLPQTSAA